MNVKNLKNRVVLITGAGSGMGRATALACARRGARLAICDMNEAGLKETAEDARALGAEVLAQTVDVTDTDEMDEFADAVHARFDTVDLLINNAGIGVGAGFFDTTPQDWDRRARGQPDGGGARLRAVHPTDDRTRHRGPGGQRGLSAGYAAIPAMFAYSVTKFATFGFSEALRIEMRRHKIGVTAIVPGPDQHRDHSHQRDARRPCRRTRRSGRAAV